MILKIQDHHFNWILIDNITKIEIREHCFKSDDKNDSFDVFVLAGEGPCKFIANNIIEKPEFYNKPNKDNPFTFLCMYLKDDIIDTYVFNTIAYLMNNDGKTIQTLYISKEVN